MKRISMIKSIMKMVLMCSVVIMVVGTLIGCGKKSEDKNVSENVNNAIKEISDSETVDNIIEEISDSENIDEISIDALYGVWQLNAETPAGDPYVYQIEIKDLGMMTFEGYSMAGGGWFQNYCYDGSIKETSGESKFPNEDSINVKIDISELDENGTETDSMSCEYSVCYTNDSKDKISLLHVSGDYLISVTDKMPLIFEKAEEAIRPGDVVLDEEYYESEDEVWQDAYWSFIDSIEDSVYESSIEYFDSMPEDTSFVEYIEGKPADTYYLYDIDDDGMPEMIVRFGTCEADYCGIVVKAGDESQLYCIGDIGLGHTVLYSDPNNEGFILQWMHMGSTFIDSVSIKNGKLVSYELLEDSINESKNGDLTLAPEFVSGAEELEPIDIHNLNAISQYREKLAREENEPTDEELRKIEEAIIIFPVYDHYLTSYGAKPDLDDCIVTLENWALNAGNTREYAGLIFETGTDELPLEHLDYENINKGDKAGLIRTDTNTLERAMQDFFNVDAELRRYDGYDYTIDDDFVTLWGNGFIVSYEGYFSEWISFNHHMDGDVLVIDAIRTTEDETEKRDDAIRFLFEYNPESFYGYSLIDYNTINSEHKLNYSMDTIKDFEKYIRNYVNNEAKDSDKVVVKAGIDGCPYERWFYYNAGTLLFAYYCKATDGSVDNRYYFMSGRMIEWIEGNGNDDSNRERYYSCDSPLDNRWKSVEKMILEDAEAYR